MQPENKNDSVQLSTRYQQYDFAKRHLRGTSRPEVFPIGKSSEISTIREQERTQTTEKGLQNTKGGGRCASSIKQINKPVHSNDRVYSEDGLSPTLNTMQGGNRQPFIAPVITPDRQNKRQNGRRFKENGEPAFTVTAQDRHGLYDGTKIRRLTPTECERLQGFPDDWTAGVSDTQRYKQCGNAVTVNVVAEIMKRLL